MQSSCHYGLSYDANGRVATSNGHGMFYTAEGFLRSIDNYRLGSYVYNALGERTLDVRNDDGVHGTWNQYVYLNSQPMADLDNTGQWNDNIYANGQKIAKLSTSQQGPTTTTYYIDDHLGTTQMELSSTGTILWQGSFTPFGQEIINGGTTNYIGNQPPDGASTKYKFTGKERDAETGLDFFGARFYASGSGRWLSPDWSATAEPIPYAKLGDPQSLNLYSYVENNPATGIDPDGHMLSFAEFEHPGSSINPGESAIGNAGEESAQNLSNQLRLESFISWALNGAGQAQQQSPYARECLGPNNRTVRQRLSL